MKKLLLTGGAGSIGVHCIADVMHNTDWEIVSLDSFRHRGYRDRLQTLLKAHPDWTPRIKEIQHDLCCPISPDLETEIGHVDYIWHLAAVSDVFFSIKNPVYTIKNNVDSTLTILEYAVKIKPEHFIYFSTDEVYGPVKKGEAHKEWDTHRPSNAYAASKAACEDICYAYWRSGLPVSITNTMNNFGEMQSSAKFPVIVQKKVEAGEVVTIHGNGEEDGSRWYIHSREVSRALRKVMEMGPHAHVTGELDEPLRVHIVGDNCYTNLEIAQMVADLSGKELKYERVDFHKDNPAHDIHYGLQDNKLRASGWEQKVPTRVSMGETVKWQREHKEWIT